jgi:hypothetical protein
VSTPNFNGWLQTAWGSGAEFWCAQPGVGNVGFVFGTNPPYYLDDFLAVNPKFFGAATLVGNATTVAGSNQVALASLAGLGYGQFIQGVGLQPGTVITVLGVSSITVNKPATASGTVTLQVYEAPIVPIMVIQLYLNLAQASLVQARWQDAWYLAMSWFIAHYLTLYVKSDVAEVLSNTQTGIHGEIPVGVQPGTVYTISAVPPGGQLQSLTRNGVFQTPGVDYSLSGITVTLSLATKTTDHLYAVWPTPVTSSTPVVYGAAQVAAQGIATGIEVSKSVGDVSVSYAQLTSLEAWGQWNLTVYGVQLASMAKVIGSGPALIW